MTVNDPRATRGTTSLHSQKSRQGAPDSLGMEERQKVNKKRLYTVKEAANYCGIPLKRIYESRRKRATEEAKARFPVKARRVGKFWLFEKKDLDAYSDSIPYSR